MPATNASEAEIRIMLQNQTRIMRKLRKLCSVDATNLNDLIDAATTALVGEFAPEAAAAFLNLRTRISQSLGIGDLVVGPALREYGKFIDAPETDIQTIITRLFKYMFDNTYTIKSRAFAFGAVTAGVGNVGDGELLRLNVDAWNYAIENQTADTKLATIVSDQNTGAQLHAEIAEVVSDAAWRDRLKITGSGAVTTVRGLTALDTQNWIFNPSFDIYSGTGSATTDLDNWVVTNPTTGAASTAFTTAQHGTAKVYRNFPGSPNISSTSASGNPASVKLDGNVQFTQTINRVGNSNRPFDKEIPYLFQIAGNRNATGCDGTLTLQLASVTVDDAGTGVTVNSATSATASVNVATWGAADWNVLRISLDTNTWARQFADVKDLAVLIKLTGNTTGSLLIDDLVIGEGSPHDGGWLFLIGGQSPFLNDDTFTYTDTNSDSTQGFIQQEIWRRFGRYLPSTAGAPTIADPTDT